MIKKHTSFRLEPELLAEARRLGLNVTALVQEALETAVQKKKCPTCGRLLKRKGTQ